MINNTLTVTVRTLNHASVPGSDHTDKVTREDWARLVARAGNQTPTLPAHAPSPTSGAPPSRIVLDDPPTGPPQARQFDPRQLDAGGLWPEGTGQTPYEVYREAFATIPSRYQIRHMNANVTDLVKWRTVTQKCAMKDFKSYDNVFDVYQNGFRQEKKAYDNRKQPTTRPEPAHARPDLYEQFGWNATSPAPA